MTGSKRTLWLIFLMLACLSSLPGLAVAASLQDKLQQLRPATAQPFSMPTYDTLAKKMADKGSVRVIIGLYPPASLPGGFADEAALQNSTAMQRQQQAVQTQQKQVLQRVSPARAAKARLFKHIPYMAMSVDQAEMDTLIASPEVRSVQEDKLSRPTLNESVPLLGAQNGTFNGYSGNGWSVAILDTGVDKTHPFLEGKVVEEACFSSTVAEEGSTTVCPNGLGEQIGTGAGVNCGEGCEHGTHVAGIAAGKRLTDFNGVAKDATIIAVQVFSRFTPAACGSSTSCVMSWDSDQIAALDYVYSLRSARNIASANMSLGGGQYTAYCDTDNAAQKASIDNLRAANIATIIASGNDGYTSSISSPACISTAISIGATTKQDAVSSFSNSAPILSLLAPGSSIYSATPGTGYASWNGTSMATPHVAGAWAVLKSAYPSKTVTELLQTLKVSGIPITDQRNTLVKSRISIANALAYLAGATQTVTVVKTGNGTGTVVSYPENISCGATCSASFVTGSNLYLVAQPAENAIFTGWSGGGCTGTGICTINSLSAAATVTANFIQATSLLSEQFDATTTPTGWTVVDNAGTGAVWRFDNPHNYANDTGGTGNFAIVDSDYAGEVNMDTELRSPALNLTGYSTVLLKFKTVFWFNSDEIADIDVSSTGADGPWTNIWRKTGLNYGPASEQIDISPLAAGKSNVMVRFRYHNAHYDWDWDIDDVAIVGIMTSSHPVLTVNHAYTSAGAIKGGGTISGSGISCSSVNGETKTGTCSASFNPGDSVSLAAAPDTNSNFVTFSGPSGCTTAGGCSFTINADTTVTGTFAGAHKAWISGGNGYDTLSLAHTNAGSGATILARELHNATSLAVEPFVENLTITKPITLKGGYNAGFSSNAGLYSTLSGILTIGGTSGSLIIEKLVIK